jgi:putative transcriptional regulator
MEDNHQVFLKGQFLVAMPGMSDPNFFQTVTCISEHTEEGAVGIIINRTHPFICANDIFDELEIKYIPAVKSIPVYIGGPVHIYEIFILHGPPFQWESCLMVNSFLALSNSKDIVEAIAMGNGPKSFMMLLGCAGWDKNQLEFEIKENVWLTCPISEKIIFEIPVKTRWEETMKNIGVNPVLLSGTAGHA